jgi:hypothetical protein
MTRITYLIPVVVTALMLLLSGVVHATTFTISNENGLAWMESTSVSISGSPTSITLYLPYNIYAGSSYPIGITVTVYNSGSSSVTATVSANCFNAPSTSLSVGATSSASTTLDVYPSTTGYLGSGTGYLSCTVSTSAGYFTALQLSFYVGESLTSVNMDNNTAYIQINTPSPLPYYSISGTNTLFSSYYVYPFYLIASGYTYPWTIGIVNTQSPVSLSTAPSGSVSSGLDFEIAISNAAVGATAPPITFTLYQTSGFGVTAGNYSKEGSGEAVLTPTTGVVGAFFGYASLLITNSSSSTTWDLMGISYSGIGNVPNNAYLYENTAQLAVLTQPGTYYGLFYLTPKSSSGELPLPVMFNVTLNPMSIVNNVVFRGNTTDIHGIYITLTPISGDLVQFNYAINVVKFLGYPSNVQWINFTELDKFDVFNATHAWSVVSIDNPGSATTKNYQSVIVDLPSYTPVLSIDGYTITHQVLVNPDIDINTTAPSILPAFYFVTNTPYNTASVSTAEANNGYLWSSADIPEIAMLGVGGNVTGALFLSAYAFGNTMVMWFNGGNNIFATNVMLPSDIDYAYFTFMLAPPDLSINTPTGIQNLDGYILNTQIGSGFDMITWNTYNSGQSEAYWYPGLVVGVGFSDIPNNTLYVIGQNVVGQTIGNPVIAYINAPMYGYPESSSAIYMLNNYIMYVFDAIPMTIHVTYANGQPAAGYSVSVSVPNIIGFNDDGTQETTDVAWSVSAYLLQPVYGNVLTTLSGVTNSSGDATVMIPAVWADTQYPTYTIQVGGVSQSVQLQYTADTLEGVTEDIALSSTPSVTISSVTVSPNPVYTTPNSTFTITVTATYNTAPAPISLTYTVVLNGQTYTETVTVPAGSTTYSVTFNLTAPPEAGTYTGTASVASSTSSESTTFTVYNGVTAISLTGITGILIIILALIVIAILYMAVKSRRGGEGGVTIRI